MTKGECKKLILYLREYIEFSNVCKQVGIALTKEQLLTIIQALVKLLQAKRK